MELLPYLLYTTVLKYPWYETLKTPHLTGIPQHIYLLSNMDIEVTNQVAL